MFEKYFNRTYDMMDFPHFVSMDKADYNAEYARMVVNEQWVHNCWREEVEHGGWKRNEREAELISAHGGLNLEICAGPGGGFTPAILMKNYNANIMISDLCPAVVGEWKKHFQKMENPPPNIEYAAFDVCDMPFIDNSIDVVSGSAAIINIEGDRDKALKEVYRILKPGGLFVFDYIFITKEFYDQMQPHIQIAIKDKYPTIFWDTLAIFDTLGFSKVETIRTGSWSNENDESGLADYCRSLNTYLTFSGFTRHCIK